MRMLGCRLPTLSPRIELLSITNYVILSRSLLIP